MNENNGLWLRRLALQIAAQLPDKPEDAMEVLKIAHSLVGFMTDGESTHLELARKVP